MILSKPNLCRMRNHYQSLVIKSIQKTPQNPLFCLSLAEYSVLTMPVNTQSLNYMSVSCQKILTETGYVNSAELERPRSQWNTDVSLSERRSKQELFLLFTPNHSISQGWASRHTYTTTGQYQADGEGLHGPRQDPTTLDSLKTLWRAEVKWAQKYLNQALGTLSTVLLVLQNEHPLGTSILRFLGGSWLIH